MFMQRILTAVNKKLLKHFRYADVVLYSIIPNLCKSVTYSWLQLVLCNDYKLYFQQLHWTELIIAYYFPCDINIICL